MVEVTSIAQTLGYWYSFFSLQLARVVEVSATENENRSCLHFWHVSLGVKTLCHCDEAARQSETRCGLGVVVESEKLKEIVDARYSCEVVTET